MKTMTKGKGEEKVVDRVQEAQVAERLKDGWSFCPKSEWKRTHKSKKAKGE